MMVLLMNLRDKVYETIEDWTKKLDNPEIAKKFEGFNKIIQIHLTDIDESMFLDFRNSSCTLFEGIKDEADASLYTTTETIFGIKKGNIDVMEAFISGKLQPKGNIKDLIILENLL